ncbi:hypothetical protein FGIG_06801 [Fasciola gigantica]|uniref:Uncharacterized protein n=1 Tax=Fasciola gigantica TaxID=46835 RepID=A0A504Z4Q5_FASGI|nr:hypothetical protein FGIG_06801 [Fasciola gigantica]
MPMFCSCIFKGAVSAVSSHIFPGKRGLLL